MIVYRGTMEEAVATGGVANCPCRIDSAWEHRDDVSTLNFAINSIAVMSPLLKSPTTLFNSVDMDPTRVNSWSI